MHRHCGAAVWIGSHNQLTALIQRRASVSAAVAEPIARCIMAASCREPQLAWRLAGSPRRSGDRARSAASRRTGACSTCEQPRAGWWCEIAGPGRALDSTRVRILGIDYLGGSGESTGPIRGRAVSRACRATIRPRRCTSCSITWASSGCARSSAPRMAAWWRWPSPSAIPSASQRLLVISAADRAASDGHRLAQRAAADRALCAGAGPLRRGSAAGARAGDGDLPQLRRSSPRASAHLPRRIDGRVRVSGRGVSVRARARLCRALSARVLPVPVRVDRSACGRCIAASHTPTTVVAVREDQLVPIGDMRALAARLPRARLHELSSPHGHDAFLKEADALRADLSSLCTE